ncbi:MAG: type II and III secretion system protein, partial [Bacteroidetes bacterium]|nr:type II and III secretion system protein [Bacteroidota bacterium]
GIILSGDQVAGIESAVTPGTVLAPASLHTKQIRINALLFELNHTKSKDTGINWSILLGSASGQSSQQQQGGAEGEENAVSFFLKTKRLIPDNDIIAAPSRIDFSDLNSLIRLAEVSGVGETIANPSLTVQSGTQGRIQIGQDIPVQTQDFAGNTRTEFFKTGIIISVTPTLITAPVADTVGAPTLDFIHLIVDVEKSSSRPTVSGPIIDRSQASTQVLLLDGEQTVIGGLFSTEQTISRTGIPVLKDLPAWFFGLRYLFGRSSESVTQKELIIVIQADVIEPLLTRAGKPFRTNLLEARREQVRKALERFNADVAGRVADPKTYKGTKEK